MFPVPASSGVPGVARLGTQEKRGKLGNKPLVSSIIIFLNAERFIAEAINSVLSQTYDNWELLLVDDGSTDGSTQIALEFAEQHPGKVRYLEHSGHRNRGKEASRNLGIDNAKGEYLAFLDADDVWLPQTLEQQTAILSSYGDAGMVYGSAQYWYSWTGDIEDATRDFRDFVEERGVKPNTLLKPPQLVTVLLRDVGGTPCICSAMLRREVVTQVGGFDEEFNGQFEDQALYVKVGLQAPVFVADKCWSKYRQHAGSSWHITQKTGQHQSARLYFLNWVAEYLSQQEIENTEVWNLLQAAQVHTSKKQIQMLNKQLRIDRKQIKELEAALERERERSKQLKKRKRGLLREVQSLSGELQSTWGYRIRKLLRKVRSSKSMVARK